MSPLTVGALFAGFGGLELGVASVLDTELAWYCENEPAAVRVLAHHFPGVPNLGDISKVDWADIQPVDVLTGGFPCQDVSTAGRRAGLRGDSRSGLWAHMVGAIQAIRPALIVIENVRGLLSAEADSAMEQCPWCVGAGPSSGLRALGAVLGDLADLRFDAEWGVFRASAVGAPHRRERVFVVAADAGRGCVQRGPVDRIVVGAPTSPTGEVAVWDRRASACAGGSTAADPTSEGRGPVRARHVAGERGEADGGRPSQPGRRGGAVADTPRTGRAQRSGAGEPRGGRPGPVDVVDLAADSASDRRGEGRRAASRRRQTGAIRDCDRDRGAPQAIADSASQRRAGGDQPRPHVVDDRPQPSHLGTHGVFDWAGYGPAIERWETILGRPAPAPTVLSARGGTQLSPAFVEWLMGLEDGWVTAVPGSTRTQQLKILGNGCVPQQVALAVRCLVPRLLDESEAAT